MKTTQSKSGFSLRTQLYGLVIAIAVVTFLGSSWVSVETTRDYLDQQMEIHAQDTATSLGLSISPFMDGDNMVIVETMIAAIFDSGYYQALVLTDVDGAVLLSRNNDVVVEGVPAWFISAFQLSPPVMTTEVNDGWRIAGTLSLKSHPGTSYAKLWQHEANNFYWSLLICLLALLVAHLILRAVLKPLAQVEDQAKAVARKQFPLIDKLPVTRELRTVIGAMNTMVTNIQTTFDQMSKHAEKLNNDVFTDPLTKLGNRRAFESRFSADREEMADNDRTTFGMVQLPSLQSINTELGFKAGDDYVCLAAATIKKQLTAFASFRLYRVGGGSFFFTLKVTGSDVLAICQSLHHKFRALNSAGYPDGFAEIIATSFNKQDQLSSLLARLDTLLTQESSALSEGVIYTDHDCRDSHGLHQWADLIDQLIKTNDVKFMFQPVKSCKNDDVLYYELFSQFFYNHTSIANNQLYAMAERLNKSQQLDKMVLSHLAGLTNLAPNTRVAINLTHQSLHDISFRNWLAKFCIKFGNTLPALIFEVNEDAVLASVESSTDFIRMIKRFNIEVCIERFGSSFTSFKYLKGLDIDYLKVDGAYISDLDQHPENSHFFHAVTQIAHGVGIKVLSTHVENAASLELLKELNCDGVQGNFIQKTKRLTLNGLQKESIDSPTLLA